MDQHFIKEKKIVDGSLSVSYVTLKDQLANVFIKGLSNMCGIHEPT